LLSVFLLGSAEKKGLEQFLTLSTVRGEDTGQINSALLSMLSPAVQEKYRPNISVCSPAVQEKYRPNISVRSPAVQEKYRPNISVCSPAVRGSVQAQ